VCRAITVSFVLLAFCFVVNGDVKDASEFGALGSLRKALLVTEANAWWHLQPSTVATSSVPALI